MVWWEIVGSCCNGFLNNIVRTYLLMIMRFTDYRMRPIGFLHDHEKKESPREKYLKNFKAFKSKRKPYSKDEDKEIIKWILKNQSFNLLNGNAV